MAKIRPLSRKMMIVLVLIIIAVVAVAAYFAYQAYEEKLRQELQHKESLRTTYIEKLGTADAAYISLQSHAGPQNKNRTEDYFAWIQEYEQKLGNYSSVVNDTRLAGSDYQQVVGNSSADDTWIVQNNTRLNQSIESLANKCSEYETDYLTVVAARDRAKQAFDAAYNNSTAAHLIANDSLFMEDYTAYPGLKAYLNACSRNITGYRDSIKNTTNSGAIYQTYLRNDSMEYDEVMTKIDSLNRNVSPLDKQYASLQRKIPTLSVSVGATDYNFSGDLGWYEYVTFLVTNNNYPAPVWNVSVHFTSFDKKTGVMKDMTDVPVTIKTQMSKHHGAILRIERGHTYDLKWTISYDY